MVKFPTAYDNAQQCTREVMVWYSPDDLEGFGTGDLALKQILYGMVAYRQAVKIVGAHR